MNKNEKNYSNKLKKFCIFIYLFNFFINGKISEMRDCHYLPIFQKCLKMVIIIYYVIVQLEFEFAYFVQNFCICFIVTKLLGETPMALWLKFCILASKVSEFKLQLETITFTFEKVMDPLTHQAMV